MSRSDTWMPLYVGDYLAATTRLTTEQHGAYFLLLLDYWKNGSPPDDDVVLAQITRLSAGAWRKTRPALIGFFEIRDGQLIQKRVEAERGRAGDVTEERSKAGKAGAAKRWHNHVPKDGKRIANANGLPLANGQQNDAPSQSHSSSSEELIVSSNEDKSVSDKPTLRPEHVVEAWNSTAERLGLPTIRKLTQTRQRQLSARIRQNTIEEFQQAIDAIERSPFLQGENDRGWRADFDFLLQPKSFTKLIEGAYDH